MLKLQHLVLFKKNEPDHSLNPTVAVGFSESDAYWRETTMALSDQALYNEEGRLHRYGMAMAKSNRAKSNILS